MVRVRARDERGVVLVLTALTLIVVLAFTALVIDLGNARQERRNRQNLADAVALAAAQGLPDEGLAVDAALEVLELNDPGATFDGCEDPGQLADLSAETECISFDSAHTRVRVKVPNEAVSTFFAGAIGVDNVITDADAVAGIVDRGEWGGILPFGLPNGAGYGPTCLKDTSSPHSTSPCNGPETGNFGKVRINLWTQGCASNGSNPAFSDNIANGSDHPLELYTGTEKLDHPCPTDTSVLSANTLGLFTGGSSSWLTRGLLSSNDDDFFRGGPGRMLRDDPALVGSLLSVENAFGATGVDDTPIWRFIPEDILGGDGLPGGGDDLQAVPTSCTREVFETVQTGTELSMYRVVGFNTSGTPGFVGFAPPDNDNDPANGYAPYVPGGTVNGRSFPGQLQLCFLEYEHGDFYNSLNQLVRAPGLDGRLGTADDGKLDPATGQPIPGPIDPDPGCGNGQSNIPCQGHLFNQDTITNDGVLDIFRTPRFGYVPRFLEPVLGPGNNCSDPLNGGNPGECHIDEWQAVYIDAFIDRSPDITWHPGPWAVPPGNARDVDYLTALSLHPNMLPDDLVTTPPCRTDEPCQGGEVKPRIELLE
jgi:hypothetical protein